MAKNERLNEEAALNNNLSAASLQSVKGIEDPQQYAEEISDGMERNQFAQMQARELKKKK